MEFASVADIVAVTDEAAPRPRGNVRGQRTRALLVESATACFAEYGYGNTRIADIVQRAGVSQGNFYRHFPGKKEIFIECLRPGLEALVESSRRTGSLAEHDDEAALVAVTVAYFRTYSRHRDILRVMREAAASTEDGFDELWLRLRGSFVDRTQHWLERLHDAGKIGDADFPTLAEVLGSMVEQVAYVHLGLPRRTPKGEDIERLGRAVGEVWYRALPRP